MREILQTCVSLDRTAMRAYQELSSACADDDLSTFFSQMAAEERHHTEWWSDLLIAWESGLVPDIADEHDLTQRLGEIEQEVMSALPERYDTLSTDEMLDVATHLEFYMLDPVFGELTDLMQPGSRVEVREAYSRHVMRVIDAVERRHSERALASFLARVLKRAYRDQQRLAALATNDQLTGLLNRRGLLGHLAQWLAWSARYSRPMAIVLLDVDHFKQINDRLGHPAGDVALKLVADALRDIVRAADLVGRFGGDEFMIIAPETTRDELVALMERIVERVASTPLELAGEPVMLSVSVGGAYTPGGVLIGDDALVSAADRSLYAAKADGRNRAAAPLPASSAVTA